jgi:hypothetical protein
MNKIMTLDGPEANARLDYLLTKARKKRMEKIVKKFQKYVATYSDQKFYKTYSDECFVNDMLYGIVIALDKKYEFGSGFQLWLKDLKYFFKHRSLRKVK